MHIQSVSCVPPSQFYAQTLGYEHYDWLYARWPFCMFTLPHSAHTGSLVRTHPLLYIYIAGLNAYTRFTYTLVSTRYTMASTMHTLTLIRTDPCYMCITAVFMCTTDYMHTDRPYVYNGFCTHSSSLVRTVTLYVYTAYLICTLAIYLHPSS